MLKQKFFFSFIICHYNVAQISSSLDQKPCSLQVSVLRSRPISSTTTAGGGHNVGGERLKGEGFGGELDSIDDGGVVFLSIPPPKVSPPATGSRAPPPPLLQA